MRLIALAAFAGLLATAAHAAGTQVNIADPTISARVARVDAGNRLAVQEVPPSTYFHAVAVLYGPSCVQIAAPPANKALIVRQVHVTVWAGSDANFVAFYDNADCGGSPRGDVLPTALGSISYSFDPGLAIPADGAFSVQNFSNYKIEVYLDGYTVIPGAAPKVAGQTFQVHGRLPTQH